MPLPKKIYVSTEGPRKERFLHADKNPAALVNLGDKPTRVGVYVLKEYVTITPKVDVSKPWPVGGVVVGK